MKARKPSICSFVSAFVSTLLALSVRFLVNVTSDSYSLFSKNMKKKKKNHFNKK